MAKEMVPAISAETRQVKAKLGLLFRKRTSLTAPHRNSSHQVGCAGLKPAPLLLKFFRQASIAAWSLSPGPASMIHFVLELEALLPLLALVQDRLGVASGRRHA
jgi:hypothetical protein